MKIAVLDLTSHPNVLDGKPRVWQQIAAWLSPALPEAEIVPFDVQDGGEALPAPEVFDGLLVSGSELGVYDETPWMVPLRELLLATKEAGKPIYGICFGHQIMADTFGGKADLAGLGTQLGARVFDMAGKSVNSLVWHQDQVTKVPPGATVTARADYCPIGALEYDFPAASVQFHPEYREETVQEYCRIFAGSELTEELVAAALSSLEDVKVAEDLQAAEAAAFFRAHVAAPAGT